VARLRVYCHTAWERTNLPRGVILGFVDWPNSGTSSHTNPASRCDVPQIQRFESFRSSDDVRGNSQVLVSHILTTTIYSQHVQQLDDPSLAHQNLHRTSAAFFPPSLAIDLTIICRRARSAWEVQPGHRVPSFRLRLGLPRPRSKLYEICRRWRPGAGAPGTAKLEKDR
jgi:hypothetical protein